MKRVILVFFIFLKVSFLSAQEQAYPLNTALWRTNKISVCWDNPTDENKEMRELVQQTIRDTWEKHSNLEFTDWVAASEKDADIHIYIDDDGPHTKGLGTQIKNMPRGMVLNFTFNNWSQSCKGEKEFCIKAIAAHEFGHALGFAHEQNRDDCKFQNCLGKEQGSNGDWYITACDLQSIMNYCNPRWSNNGSLSELDIQAVQYLYGKPSIRTNEFVDLQLVHTSNQIKKPRGRRISHEIKIYLAGQDAELDNVERVVYHLHPTFKNNEMNITSRTDKFGLGLRVWGQFQLTADIYKKDGKKIVLTRYLDFDGTGVKPN